MNVNKNKIKANGELSGARYRDLMQDSPCFICPFIRKASINHLLHFPTYAKLMPKNEEEYVACSCPWKV